MWDTLNICPPCGPPSQFTSWPSISCIFSAQSPHRHIWGLFSPRSSGSKQCFGGFFSKPEVSPCSDSSRGMMFCFDSSGDGEQPVRTCLSRGGRDAIVSTSAAPKCFPLPDVNSCLWEGGRDDGKMFFPTCAMWSSCCDTEIEKHPYFHFLTFSIFPPTFASQPSF